MAPQLSQDLAGGIFHPDEAHCDPLRFVLAIGAWATELGVEIRTMTEVLGVRRDGPRIRALQTSQGELLVDEVVLAAGVWSGRLARELELPLALEGGKGYHIDVEAQVGDPSFPIWLHESRVVITPLGARVRLAGTLELDGHRPDDRPPPCRRDHAGRGPGAADLRLAPPAARLARPAALHPGWAADHRPGTEPRQPDAGDRARHVGAAARPLDRGAGRFDRTRAIAGGGPGAGATGSLRARLERRLEAAGG